MPFLPHQSLAGCARCNSVRLVLDQRDTQNFQFTASVCWWLFQGYDGNGKQAKKINSALFTFGESEISMLKQLGLSGHTAWPQSSNLQEIRWCASNTAVKGLAFLHIGRLRLHNHTVYSLLCKNLVIKEILHLPLVLQLDPVLVPCSECKNAEK